jgi:hypothetical protein
MRYKVGDNVRIRTWDDLEYNYGLNYQGNLQAPFDPKYPTYFFKKENERVLNLKHPDRILKILKVCEGYYLSSLIPFAIAEYMIEDLIEEIFDPIHSRFEILDL